MRKFNDVILNFFVPLLNKKTNKPKKIKDKLSPNVHIAEVL